MPNGFFIPPQLPALNSDFFPRYFFTPDPEDEPIATSYLGTPVYSNLIFSSEGVDVGSATTVNPNAGKQDLRIDTVLMIVQQTKNIVKTSIQGRNGTVKEFISEGDYMVTIMGAIVSPAPLVYPREDVDLLLRYLKLNTQIPVISFFLDLFGIDSIVIEDYEFPEKMGSRNEQPFKILASSDRPLEFQLNPNKGI